MEGDQRLLRPACGIEAVERRAGFALLHLLVVVHDQHRSHDELVQHANGIREVDDG